MKNKYIGIDTKDIFNKICELYLSGLPLAKITTEIKTSYNIAIYPKEIKQILCQNNISLRTKEENRRLAVASMKQTNLERYGTECSLCNKDIYEKAKQTNLVKYGAENPFSSTEVQNKIKQTNLERYGVEYASQNEGIKVKTQQTCIERYGANFISQVPKFKEKAKETLKNNYNVNTPLQAPEILEKSKRTCLEKYGTEFSFASENNKEKSKQTCLKKYGTENPAQADSIKQKTVKTNLKKYGVPSVLQTKSVQAKIKQTNLERYGVENVLQNTNIKDKAVETILTKYGTTNVFVCSEIRLKAKKTMFKRYGCLHPLRKIYGYENEYFDSFPELCIFMYCNLNNIPVIREPKELTFIFEEKQYHYYPDFKINNTLYEIKGTQFLKEDGTWQNPYDHTQDKLYEAKHQCALENNVEILYNADYQKYIDWFNNEGYKKTDFCVEAN